MHLCLSHQFQIKRILISESTLCWNTFKFFIPSLGPYFQQKNSQKIEEVASTYNRSLRNLLKPECDLCDYPQSTFAPNQQSCQVISEPHSKQKVILKAIISHGPKNCSLTVNNEGLREIRIIPILSNIELWMRFTGGQNIPSSTFAGTICCFYDVAIS